MALTDAYKKTENFLNSNGYRYFIIDGIAAGILSISGGFDSDEEHPGPAKGFARCQGGYHKP